jgi:hypothetical protein
VASAGLLISGGAAVPGAQVPVTILRFPGGWQDDGFWTAIKAASDGRVYVGLCGHGGSARMYVYEPATKEIRHLAMMQAAVHEERAGREPQGKLHSQIVEDPDGNIWFGTDMASHSYLGMWDDPRAYPGGHMMLYHPKTDLLQDLGILAPGAGIRHIVMDSQRRRIYAVTFPRGEFYVYDMNTRRPTFKGRVNNVDSIARVMVKDDQGNVYGSFAPYRIFKYDIEKERLVDLPVTIPHKEGPWCDRGHFHRENIWRNAVWDPAERVIWGMEMGSATFFRFDPARNSIEALGQLVSPEFEGERIVPYTSHGFALHPNRKIYYTAPLAEYSQPTPLVEFDTRTRQKRVLGGMADKSGWIPAGIEGCSIGPDGSIYFAGWVKPASLKSASKREGSVLGLVILKAADIPPGR